MPLSSMGYVRGVDREAMPMDLTQREREVLLLLARGLTYDEIGRLLDVSINTVRTHVRAVYAKLGVGNKTEAALEGLRLGLI